MKKEQLKTKSFYLLSFIVLFSFQFFFLSEKASANISHHITIFDTDGSHDGETDVSANYTSPATFCASGGTGVCKMNKLSSFDGTNGVSSGIYFNGFGPIYISNLTDSPSTVASGTDGLYVVSRNGTKDGYNQPYIFFYKSGTSYIYVTYIIAQESFSIPTNSSITLLGPTGTQIGNPITITGTYTNTQTYNQIAWEIKNLTSGSTLNIATSSIAFANGTFTFSKTITLTFQGNYSAKAYLQDTTTGSSTASNLLLFGLNSATSTNILIGELTSTTTADFLGFLNVPELLKTKVPFGYFYQFSQQFTTIFSTTTQTFASTSIPLPFTTHVDFSTTTMAIFINPTSTGWTLIRTILSAALYFAAIIFIWKDWRRHI